MLNWLRSRLAPPPQLPAPDLDARPSWVAELMEALQKQSRVLAKQGARFEGGLGEIDARVEGLREMIEQAAPRTSPAISYDDVFDALDALDEAQRSVDEPHLAEGLLHVAERLARFCERGGYTRLAPRGEQPDPRTIRVVGTEHRPGSVHGRITRVVRAAILSGTTVVREGEALVHHEGESHGARMGH